VLTMRERIGLAGVLADKTFDNFDPDYQEPKHRPSMHVALKEARGFMDKRRTIVFHGPNGVGKTHLACAIGNALIEQHGMMPVPVCFISFQDVLLKIRETYRDHYEGMGETWLLEKWLGVPVLILDEVGQRGLEERPSEFTRRIGYQLIDGRYRMRNRPIILTTNKNPGKLGEWITESAVDRLFEMGTFVQMEGRSWRRSHQ
jgi:DNA replication protein DnaC